MLSLLSLDVPIHSQEILVSLQLGGQVERQSICLARGEILQKEALRYGKTKALAILPYCCRTRSHAL